MASSTPSPASVVVSALSLATATPKTPAADAWRVQVTVRAPLSDRYALDYDAAFPSYHAAVDAAAAAIDAHVCSPYASRASTRVPVETPATAASRSSFRVQARVAETGSDLNAMEVTVAFRDYLDAINAAVGAIRNQARRPRASSSLSQPRMLTQCAHSLPFGGSSSSSTSSPALATASATFGGSDGDDVDSRGVTNGSSSSGGGGAVKSGATGGSDGTDVGDTSGAF